MSINDPIEIVYYERRKTYILKQGRETFYDENNYMLEWETVDQAELYAFEILGKGAHFDELDGKDTDIEKMPRNEFISQLKMAFPDGIEPRRTDA